MACPPPSLPPASSPAWGREGSMACPPPCLALRCAQDEVSRRSCPEFDFSHPWLVWGKTSSNSTCFLGNVKEYIFSCVALGLWAHALFRGQRGAGGGEQDRGDSGRRCHSGAGGSLCTGGGMDLRECLQPCVVPTLSCFGQEPSKDPEHPRGEGLSPFPFFSPSAEHFFGSPGCLRSAGGGFTLQHQLVLCAVTSNAPCTGLQASPSQGGSAAPGGGGGIWGPQTSGCDPRAGAALAAHPFPEHFSFLLSRSTERS